VHLLLPIMAWRDGPERVLAWKTGERETRDGRERGTDERETRDRYERERERELFRTRGCS
jgi:hypothetical protein